MLDVSLRTIETMCTAGELEVIEVRGAPRVSVASVLEYLETHRRAPRARAPSRSTKDRALDLIDGPSRLAG